MSCWQRSESANVKTPSLINMSSKCKKRNEEEANIKIDSRSNSLGWHKDSFPDLNADCWLLSKYFPTSYYYSSLLGHGNPIISAWLFYFEEAQSLWKDIIQTVFFSLCCSKFCQEQQPKVNVKEGVLVGLFADFSVFLIRLQGDQVTDAGAKVAFYLPVSGPGLGLQQQQQMLWQFLLMILQKREITCQHVQESLDLQSLFFFL